MPREAGLFEQTDGSPLEAFLLLRQSGGNVPPMWIERAKASRKHREKQLSKALRSKSLDAVYLLREWETYFRKEMFYYGIRVLMELERKGASKL